MCGPSGAADVRRPVRCPTGVLASTFTPLSLSLPRGSAWKGQFGSFICQASVTLLHGAAEEPDWELLLTLDG